MKAAYDAGVNFFDCAEGYAGGESERVMGEAIKKFGWKRNDLVISTKVPLHTPTFLPHKLTRGEIDLLGSSPWRQTCQ